MSIAKDIVKHGAMAEMQNKPPAPLVLSNEEYLAFAQEDIYKFMSGGTNDYIVPFLQYLGRCFGTMIFLEIP